jgi:hypothetical protein
LKATLSVQGLQGLGARRDHEGDALATEVIRAGYERCSLGGEPELPHAPGAVGLLAPFGLVLPFRICLLGGKGGRKQPSDEARGGVAEENLETAREAPRYASPLRRRPLHVLQTRKAVIEPNGDSHSPTPVLSRRMAAGTPVQTLDRL